MQYWFIVHDRYAFYDRDDLIGFSARKSDPTKPHLNAAYEMKPGDRLIYYMKAPDSAILGTFEILEGVGYFYKDWEDGKFQFKIKKIEICRESPIPIQELVPKLDFFKGYGERSWPYKLRTAIQSISQDDYSTIESLLKERSKKIEENDISVDRLESKTSKKEQLDKSEHSLMISVSHSLAEYWNFYSFVGKKEQSQIYEGFSEMDLENLPEWLAIIARDAGYFEQINQIDNIWFMQEEGNFLIPVVAFEHERSRNYRAIFDRFNALKEVLNKNRRFRNITPGFLVIVPDESDYQYFNTKLEQDGNWKKFSEKNDTSILTINELKNRTKDIMSSINQIKDINQHKYFNLDKE